MPPSHQVLYTVAKRLGLAITVNTAVPNPPGTEEARFPRALLRSNLRATLTPLHIGAQWGQVEVCEWLLSQGANLMAKSLKMPHSLAINYAVQEGKLDVLRLFLNHRPSLAGSQNSNRESPLHYAADNAFGTVRRPRRRFPDSIRARLNGRQPPAPLEASFSSVHAVGDMPCGRVAVVAELAARLRAAFHTARIPGRSRTRAHTAPPNAPSRCQGVRWRWRSF